MNLKAATLIAIIGLTVAFFLMSMIDRFHFPFYVYPAVLCLPLINFFIALYIKQK